MLKYNSQGELIEEDLFRSDDKKFSQTLFTRDSLNSSSHYEQYDMFNKLQSTRTSTTSMFDKNGNWQIKKITQFHHTQNAGDVTESILIKRKIEYY